MPLLSCGHTLIDKALMSAFSERWHRDTCSFHLPVGEMTITLDDVSALLHIPIRGAFWSISIVDRDHAVQVVTELLGVSVTEANGEILSGLMVRCNWLLEVYYSRCEEQKFVEATRALLLCLVGTTIFTNKSGHAVYIYYLELFRDLHHCRSYAWGVGALTHLYEALRDGSLPHTRGLCAFLTLLQVSLFIIFYFLTLFKFTKQWANFIM